MIDQKRVYPEKELCEILQVKPSFLRRRIPHYYLGPRRWYDGVHIHSALEFRSPPHPDEEKKFKVRLHRLEVPALNPSEETFKERLKKLHERRPYPPSDSTPGRYFNRR